MSNPPCTPAERFAATLFCLTQAVVTRGLVGLLASALVSLLVDRIREIKQRFARIAARLQAGTFVPRRLAAPRRPPAVLRPRQPDPLPKNFGWLLKLLPEAVQYRGQLDHLLNDPEMAALMQAAPESMRRAVRSACRMLGIRPPPIVAPPARPRAPPAQKSAPPEPKPPQPPPPAPPEWLRGMPRSAQWPGPRLRGPPRPA